MRGRMFPSMALIRVKFSREIPWKAHCADQASDSLGTVDGPCSVTIRRDLPSNTEKQPALEWKRRDYPCDLTHVSYFTGRYLPWMVSGVPISTPRRLSSLLFFSSLSPVCLLAWHP